MGSQVDVKWSRMPGKERFAPSLPTEEDFPYAIRSVTEIMSQERFDFNGGDLF